MTVAGCWVYCGETQYIVVSVEQRATRKRFILRKANDDGNRYRLDANDISWHSRPTLIRK